MSLLRPECVPMTLSETCPVPTEGQFQRSTFDRLQTFPSSSLQNGLTLRRVFLRSFSNANDAKSVYLTQKMSGTSRMIYLSKSEHATPSVR